MSTIITGHFDHIEQLQEAVRRLQAEGYTEDDYEAYFLNPPGQHGLYKLGGDAPSDEGSRDAGKGAAAGALMGGAAGLAIGSLAGPIGALAGSGVGAYIGAFAGALNKANAPHPEHASTDRPAEHAGGPMMAVNVDRPGSETTVVAIFTQANANCINRGTGEWVDGEWRDFDPRQPLHVVYQREPS